MNMFACPQGQQGVSYKLRAQHTFAPRPNFDPPLAPDGIIPHSILWRDLLEFGFEQETTPRELYRPPVLSDEQRNLLVQPPDSESDSEDNALFGLLQPRGESSEQSSSEDEHVPEDDLRQFSRRTSPKTFRPLTPRSRPQTATPPTPRDSPRRVATPPHEEKVVSVAREATPPAEVRPALPRALSQFRDLSWFEFHFPRATAKTFDFLRAAPSHDALEVLFPQISFTSIVALLISQNVTGPQFAPNTDPDSKYRGLYYATGERGRQCDVVRAVAVLAADTQATEEDRATIIHFLVNELSALNTTCQKSEEGVSEDGELANALLEAIGSWASVGGRQVNRTYNCFVSHQFLIGVCVCCTWSPLLNDLMMP